MVPVWAQALTSRQAGIPFAISADLNAQTRAAITALPQDHWRSFRHRCHA